MQSDHDLMLLYRLYNIVLCVTFSKSCTYNPHTIHTPNHTHSHSQLQVFGIPFFYFFVYFSNLLIFLCFSYTFNIIPKKENSL